MQLKLLASVAATCALTLWAGQAAADVFTLNLTGATPVFSTSDDGTVHTVRYDFDLSGFPDVFPSVQVGDEIIVNLTFADGAITLPGTAFIDVTNLILTGDGFPAGDTATYGTTTLYSGGLLGAVVAAGSEGDPMNFGTTTSAQLASAQVFGGPLSPLTFDSVRTDFFVAQIAGSTQPGTFATLDRAFFSADSRDFDAAPEPASWALMVLGFGGLGAALRARRAIRLA